MFENSVVLLARDLQIMLKRSSLLLNSHLVALGLVENRSYSAEEIKTAFRTKAKELHPDVKGGDSEKFREVSIAYRTLTGKEGHAGSEWARGFYDHVHCRTTRGNNSTEGNRHSGPQSFDGTYSEYPNETTKDFYRPYSGTSGFTVEELAEAEKQNRLFLAYRGVKLLSCVAILWYMVHVFCREEPTSSTPQPEGQSHTRSSPMRTELSNIKKPKFIRPERFSGGAYAVSYRGRPFTVEGLESARSGNHKTSLQASDDESETVEGGE